MEKAHFPIRLMCRVLGVSPSGYYAWCSRSMSARTQEDQRLIPLIEKIHRESRQTYGSPRVVRELRSQKESAGRHRVARLMRALGLKGLQPKRFRCTTDSNHQNPVAENFLNRNFEAEDPDKSWVADITYIWTRQGWLYLAIVLDLFSRRVVGWSMASDLRTQLVLDALEMALGQRGPVSDLLFHSDRGSQYAAHEFQEALASAGIRCSMSRRGNCWDNAVAESFFATLKKELVHRSDWPTRAAARTAIFDYLEVFYNRQRRHSSLGYLSPVEFERQNPASKETDLS